MVRTRSQLEHLLKDELVDEFMSIEDISSKLVNLTTRFDDFTRRFEILSFSILSYKCRQLKNARKIHSTWFWNNVINVKLNERSQPAKIYHIIDIEKLPGVDNLDEFINNTSF